MVLVADAGPMHTAAAERDTVIAPTDDIHSIHCLSINFPSPPPPPPNQYLAHFEEGIKIISRVRLSTQHSRIAANRRITIGESDASGSERQGLH